MEDLTVTIQLADEKEVFQIDVTYSSEYTEWETLGIAVGKKALRTLLETAMNSYEAGSVVRDAFSPASHAVCLHLWAMRNRFSNDPSVRGMRIRRLNVSGELTEILQDLGIK